MTEMQAEPARFELAAPNAELMMCFDPGLAPGETRLQPSVADAGSGVERSTMPADLSRPAGFPTSTGAPPVAGAASRLRPLELAELFALPIKPRGMVLDPIIPEKGLAMLYGSRGTGKTHVALGVAYAAATGSAFLKWRAERPRRVLLIDGEMPAQALRERLARVVAGGTGPCAPPTLRILAGDLVEHGIGNLAEPAVQAELDPWLAGVELLILDNLSSLTASVRENDADAWAPIQQWLLRLRRRGLSVLIVHHAGKRGGQRGTSRREDVLDTSISLRRPGDYAPTEGARFTVHIEKGRSIHGAEARPFEARLAIIDGRTAWTMKEAAEVDRERVASLLAAGMSIRDIADEAGLAKSTVHRLTERIRQEAAAARNADAAALPPAAAEPPGAADVLVPCPST